MPEEHTYNQPPNSGPQMQNNVAPEAPNQASHPVYPQANVAEHNKPTENRRPEAFSNFGEGNPKSMAPSVLVWLAFALTLLVTGYFWLLDFGNVKSISEKENEKNQITAQLSSANNKEAEEKALGFSTAFTELSNLVNNSVPKATLLTELYATFTKDVKISTLALSTEGGLSLDGATGTYRQAADFMLGLQTNKKVSNVVLKSVALNSDEGVAANQKVKFSISADMQMTKEEAKTETSADGTPVTPSATDTSATNSTSTTTTPTSTSTSQ